jgi:hypothetical protein
MSTAKPKNLYEHLNFIKPHIHLYIGSKSLRDLQLYISGFKASDWVNNKTEELRDLIEFHDFVARQYNLESSGDGWPRIILNHCKGDQQNALTEFFRLLELFKNENSSMYIFKSQNQI